MSHLEKILDEIFGKKKPKQVEVAVERLYPPMAPPKEGWSKDKHGMWVRSKPIASEKSVEDISEIEKDSPQQSDSKLAIDLGSMPTEYWQYCDCNDAKRNWIRVKFGMSHRGTTAQLKRDVKKISDNMEFINKNQAVINEFKAKVKKLQEKRVE